MQSKSFNRIKTLLLCSSIVTLTSGCQINNTSPTKPLSIIYGHKDGNGKGIYMSDDEGKTRVNVLNATLSDGYPAMSPNGKVIAFYGKYDKYRTWSIHTADADGNNVRRLTNKKHVWDSAPAWSPDNTQIAFAREYKDQNEQWLEEIWLMNFDGTNKRQITALEGRSPQFLPDGRILFQSKSSPSQISIADIDGSNVIQLTNDDTNNMQPKISPDGSKIAYLSNRDGNQEVYVMNLDGTNQQRVTKNSIQEWDPVWSPDGSKVFFSSQNVHGFYDIYKANIDGTSKEKVLENASQGGTISQLDQVYSARLLSQ